MLTFEEDEYTLDIMRGHGRWVVVLSNGQRVFQDDERPGQHPHSAWERLYYYCLHNDLYIVDMYIQFRSHVESMPSNCDGYFFSKAVLSGMLEGKTKQLFLIGTLNGQTLSINTWQLPELLITETEERNPEVCGVNLIKRKK